MASGNTLFVFDPLAARPPVSDYAQVDVRNGSVVLDFDDASDESVDFFAVVPAHYAGGGFEIVVTWAATVATSCDVRWSAALECIDAGSHDLDAEDFGTATTAADTTQSTSGQVTKTTLTVAHVDAGSPAASDALRLRLSRDADHASDTMTGDAELLAVEIREA